MARALAAGLPAWLLLGSSVLAQTAPQDFRLPPPRPAPTQTGPEQEGPVAPDLPASRPSAAPAPTPTPTITAPAGPPPLVVPPPPTTQAAPPDRQPQARPIAVATPTPTPSAAVPAGPTPSASPASDSPLPAPAASAPPPPVAQDEEGGVTLLGWLILAAALAGGALLLVLRRRRSARPPEARPVPAASAVPAPSPPPPPAPAPAPAAPPPLTGLELEFVAERLSLSLMNAALACRLTLVNEGAEPLHDLTVRADLTGAHAALPPEEQLGGPAPDAPILARVPLLAVGEAHAFTAELRLPLAAVPAIRQGQAALFVPLLRLVLAAEGQGRRTATLLVGPPGQNGQVQPVRLDAGPRVLAPLAARALG